MCLDGVAVVCDGIRQEVGEILISLCSVQCTISVYGGTRLYQLLNWYMGGSIIVE